MDWAFLRVWTPHDGRLALESSAETRRLALIPSQLVVSDDGYFALAKRRGGGGADLVWHLTRSGQVVRSFAPWPEDSVAEGRPLVGRGGIAWHAATRRLAVVHRNALAGSVFSQDGKLLLSLPEILESAAPGAPVGPTERPEISQIMHTSYLPGGELAVATVEASSAQAGKGGRAFFLRLLDEKDPGSMTRILIGMGAGGILQGASSSGALVFAAISPQAGIQIVAARLSRAGPLIE